ncbi:MAG: hypothetical protein GY714_04980 [Desulfobacterales bacterium]|nr:hypothetical protein [Desulfobacterales bacterium]
MKRLTRFFADLVFFFLSSRLYAVLLASDNAQNLSAVCIPFLCGGIVSIIPLVPTRRKFLFKQTYLKDKIIKFDHNYLNDTPYYNPTQTTTTTEHYPNSHPSPSTYQTLPTPTKPVAPHLFSIIATLRDNFFSFFLAKGENKINVKLFEKYVFMNSSEKWCF